MKHCSRVLPPLLNKLLYLAALSFLHIRVSWSEMIFTRKNSSDWISFGICRDDAVYLECNVGNTDYDSNICNRSQYLENFWSYNISYGRPALQLNHTVYLDGCRRDSNETCEISCDASCQCFRQSNHRPCDCDHGTYPPTVSPYPSPGPTVTGSPTILTMGGTVRPTRSISPSVSASPTVTNRPTSSDSAIWYISTSPSLPPAKVDITDQNNTDNTGNVTQTPDHPDNGNDNGSNNNNGTNGNNNGNNNNGGNGNSTNNSSEPLRFPFHPFQQTTPFYSSSDALITCPAFAKCSYDRRDFGHAKMMVDPGPSAGRELDGRVYNSAAPSPAGILIPQLRLDTTPPVGLVVTTPNVTDTSSSSTGSSTDNNKDDNEITVKFDRRNVFMLNECRAGSSSSNENENADTNSTTSRSDGPPTCQAVCSSVCVCEVPSSGQDCTLPPLSPPQRRRRHEQEQQFEFEQQPINTHRHRSTARPRLVRHTMLVVICLLNVVGRRL